MQGGANRESREKPKPPERIRGARILLAEDNEINQQFAMELLEDAALHVEIAADGKQAFHMAKQGEYDIVLMDIQMPEMDGYEATGKIRGLKNENDPALKERGEVPIIAMTAHAMSSDLEKSRMAGMNAHIAKPINPIDLFLALDTHIGRELKNPVAESDKKMKKKGANEAQLSEGPPLPDALACIDLESIIGKMGGRETSVKKLLAKFALLQRDTDGKIVEALQEGDTKTATRLCHNLKGVAGNIGAYELSSAAAEMEFALSNNQEGLQDMTERLILELERVLSDIDSLELDRNPKHAPVRNKKEDLSKAIPLLDELKMLLEESDMDAVIKLEEIKNILTGASYREKIEELERSLASYDSEEALQALKEIMDHASLDKNNSPPRSRE